MSIMEIVIDSKRNNPLLNRTEIYFTVKHEGEGTPNREIIRSELAEKINVNKYKVIINTVLSSCGSQEISCYAKIYQSLDQSKEIEPDHILKRNKLIESEKGKAEKTKKEEKKPVEEPKAESPKQKPEEKPEIETSKEPTVDEKTTSEDKPQDTDETIKTPEEPEKTEENEKVTEPEKTDEKKIDEPPKEEQENKTENAKDEKKE